MSKKKKNSLILMNIMILCLVTLSAVTFCLFMIYRYKALAAKEQQEAAMLTELQNLQASSYTKEQVEEMISISVEDAVVETKASEKQEVLNALKQALAQNSSPLKAIRTLFPEEIILPGNKNYVFLPIDRSLHQNNYEDDNFVTKDNGLLSYEKNGTVISKVGIDVSKFQEKVDWKQVAQADVDFAIIRVGVRGYSEGSIMADDYFDDNMKGAINNRIDVGTYFVTQAVSVEEAIEEAEYVLDQIEPYNLTYPVVIDVEEVSGVNKYRTKDLEASLRTDCVIAFCETIKNAGYTPMIYGNMYSFLYMMEYERLESYEKWFACYDQDIYFPYEYSIWQYKATGSIPGIKTDVDLNIGFFEPDR